MGAPLHLPNGSIKGGIISRLTERLLAPQERLCPKQLALILHGSYCNLAESRNKFDAAFYKNFILTKFAYILRSIDTQNTNTLDFIIPHSSIVNLEGHVSQIGDLDTKTSSTRVPCFEVTSVLSQCS